MRQLRINCVGIVLFISCMHATNLWSSQASTPNALATRKSATSVISNGAATGKEKKEVAEKEAKEKVKRQDVLESQVICHIPTVNEEFEFLQYVIGRLPFYKENYPQHKVESWVPQHQLFQEIYQKPTMFLDLGYEAVQKTFQNEVYDKHAYEKACDVISSKKVQGPIQCALTQLAVLQKNWGFKIFPQYTIALTLYGPGGNYDPSISTISIKVAPQMVPLTPSKTIIHETIHMGIEENIVQKYKLTHFEKERLVDLICSLYLKEILPDYSIQKAGDRRIDPYVTLDAIVHNLPAALEQFVKQYPR